MSDDIDFKQAMRGVRRLHNKDVVQTKTTKSLGNHALRRKIQNRSIHSSTLHVEPNKINAGDEICGRRNQAGDNVLFFLRDGQQNKVLHDLKKGVRYSISQTLDLHGLSQIKAQELIDSTVRSLHPLQQCCLLIIHGKGLHSSDGPTLKTFTANYLCRLTSIKAYCSAQQHDGGTGALYVLVKK